MKTWLRTLVLISCLGATASAGDQPGLTIADLEAYRLALRPAASASTPSVGFRDLWEHPDSYAGRRVRVEGRLARLFRQPPLGEFPALAEAWVVSEAGDPLCLVYPDVPASSTPEIGSHIRFEGTYLRRVQYRGRDVSRLAPLLVGPGSPAGDPGTIPTAWPGSSADWLMGLGAACVVAVILVGRHLARPHERPVAIEPPPAFLDGDGGADDHA